MAARGWVAHAPVAERIVAANAATPACAVLCCHVSSSAWLLWAWACTLTLALCGLTWTAGLDPAHWPCTDLGCVKARICLADGCSLCWRGSRLMGCIKRPSHIVLVLQTYSAQRDIHTDVRTVLAQSVSIAPTRQTVYAYSVRVWASQADAVMSTADAVDGCSPTRMQSREHQQHANPSSTQRFMYSYETKGSFRYFALGWTNPPRPCCVRAVRARRAGVCAMPCQ